MLELQKYYLYCLQVVNGRLVSLTLEIGSSSCRKGSNKTNEECSLKTDSVILWNHVCLYTCNKMRMSVSCSMNFNLQNNQICNVEVWIRDYLNKREVVKSQCSPKRDRRVSIYIFIVIYFALDIPLMISYFY